MYLQNNYVWIVSVELSISNGNKQPQNIELQKNNLKEIIKG